MRYMSLSFEIMESEIINSRTYTTVRVPVKGEKSCDDRDDDDDAEDEDDDDDDDEA